MAKRYANRSEDQLIDDLNVSSAESASIALEAVEGKPALWLGEHFDDLLDTLRAYMPLGGWESLVQRLATVLRGADVAAAVAALEERDASLEEGARRPTQLRSILHAAYIPPDSPEEIIERYAEAVGLASADGWAFAATLPPDGKKLDHLVQHYCRQTLARRVQAARAEIQEAAKLDPHRGASGAIEWMERFVAAFGAVNVADPNWALLAPILTEGLPAHPDRLALLARLVAVIADAGDWGRFLVPTLGPLTDDADAADFVLEALARIGQNYQTASMRLFVLHGQERYEDMLRRPWKGGAEANPLCIRLLEDAYFARGHVDAALSEYGLPHARKAEDVRRLAERSGIEVPDLFVRLTANPTRDQRYDLYEIAVDLGLGETALKWAQAEGLPVARVVGPAGVERLDAHARLALVMFAFDQLAAGKVGGGSTTTAGGAVRGESKVVDRVVEIAVPARRPKARRASSTRSSSWRCL